MNEQQRKKKLWTKGRVITYGILGFITTAGAAAFTVDALARWGCRHFIDPYIKSYEMCNFDSLHQPIIKEVAKLKEDLSDVKHDTKLTRYISEASASDRVRAMALENMRRDSIREATWRVR